MNCGSAEVKKGWFGATCESGYECKRTEVCDDYDDFVATKGRCPAGEALKVTIATKRVGSTQVADHVEYDCINP